MTTHLMTSDHRLGGAHYCLAMARVASTSTTITPNFTSTHAWTQGQPEEDLLEFLKTLQLSRLHGSATNVIGSPRSQAAHGQDVAVPFVGPRHAADAEGHLAGLDFGEPVLPEHRRQVLKSLDALAERLRPAGGLFEAVKSTISRRPPGRSTRRISPSPRRRVSSGRWCMTNELVSNESSGKSSCSKPP
jgi:hypothetical protein